MLQTRILPGFSHHSADHDSAERPSFCHSPSPIPRQIDPTSVAPAATSSRREAPASRCRSRKLPLASSVFLLHSPPAGAIILPNGRTAEGFPEGSLPAPAAQATTRRASRVPTCCSPLSPTAPAILSLGPYGRGDRFTSTAPSNAGPGAETADKTMAYGCVGRHLPRFRHNLDLTPTITAT